MASTGDPRRDSSEQGSGSLLSSVEGGGTTSPSTRVRTLEHNWTLLGNTGLFSQEPDGRQWSLAPVSLVREVEHRVESVEVTLSQETPCRASLTKLRGQG